MGDLINLDGKPLLSADVEKAKEVEAKHLLIEQLKSTIELALDSAKQRWNKACKEDKISMFLKGGIVESSCKVFLQLHIQHGGSEYVIFREERVFPTIQELYHHQIDWEYDLSLAFIRSMILGSVDSFIMRLQVQRQVQAEQHAVMSKQHETEEQSELLQSEGAGANSSAAESEA